MRRLIYVLLIVALLSVGFSIPRPVAAQTDVPWPYIYYFEAGTNAWVIERADGADRVIFGAGSTPGRVYETAWSTTGNWLLWTYGTPPGAASGVVVANIDGRAPLTIPDQLWGWENHNTFRWSPQAEDLLLMTALYPPGETGADAELAPAAYVIDAERDEIVFTVEYDYPYVADWSPDGQAVVLFDWETRDHVLVVPLDGGPTVRRDLVAGRYLDPDPRIGSDWPYGELPWMADGIRLVQVRDAGTLVVEDWATGARDELAFTPDAARFLVWNPARQTGLIYAGSAVWLLSLAERSLRQVADGVVAPAYAFNLQEDYEQPSFAQAAWSPDGRDSLFATEDGALHLVSADGTVTPVDVPPAASETVEHPRVQWGGDAVFILWNDRVYACDVFTGHVLFSVPANEASGTRDDPAWFYFSVSSDGRYVAYARGYENIIRDRSADSEVALIPNPAIEESYRQVGGATTWYPGRAVVIVGNNVPTPGAGYSMYSVTTADGRFLRRIPGYSSMPQPLPAQVDLSFAPASAAPSVPEPSLTITTGSSTWIGAVVWSADGRYLATTAARQYGQAHSACSGGHPVQVWAADTGQLVNTFDLDGCPCGYNPGDGSDSPAGEVYLSLRADQDWRPAQVTSAVYSGSAVDFVWPSASEPTVLGIVIDQCFGMDDVFVLWDFEADEVIATYPGVTAIAFSADGAQAALGYADGTLALTRYPDIDPQARFAALDAPIARLAFDASGARLAAQTAQDLSVWETATGAILARAPFSGAAESLGLSPDGARLVTAGRTANCDGGADLPPSVLDVTSGELLTAQNDDLRAAAFSPDGRILASTGCGLDFWDATTLERIGSLPMTGVGLAWKPDGTQLAVTASFAIYIWDVDLDR